MTLNMIYNALKDYMDASLGVNGEITRKAEEALEALKGYCWIPVTQELPETDEDGWSGPVLISFANASSFLCIGHYIVDNDGNGAFYEGDDDEEPLSDFDLIVNAWTKIPESYREDD